MMVRSSLQPLQHVPEGLCHRLVNHSRLKTAADVMQEVYDLCTPEQWDEIGGCGYEPIVPQAMVGELGELKYEIRRVRGQLCVEVKQSGAVGFLGQSQLDLNCGDPAQIRTKGQGWACYLLEVDDD